MSQHYKITLKPIGSFYFGGEDSFSSAKLKGIKEFISDSTLLDEEKKKKFKEKQQKYFKKRQGYFAKSEKFPQQTQLLGMIRKELLRHNGKLLYFKNFMRVPTKYKYDANKIVGETRWTSKDSLNLGAIEELSPLYLQHDKKKKLFIPAPFDYGLSVESSGSGHINGRKGKAYRFIKNSDGKAFGAKDYLCSDFIDSDKNRIKLDKVFTSFVQTHTQTLGYKQDNEEQLFKVKQYRLDEAYSFVFFLTLGNENYLEDKFTTTVELGGERSLFQMSVEKTDKTLEKKSFGFLQNSSDRVVLLSDSYVDASLLNECKVTLAKKVPFRMIKRKDRSFDKTAKVILLLKGSVFYPKNEESKTKIIKNIESYKNYTTIGYNNYLELPKKGEKNVK